MLQTMALSFIRAMWSSRMTPKLPVAVTKMSTSETTSSVRTIWNPSMAACSAQMGSISVTSTRAPCPLMDWAAPLAHLAESADQDGLSADHDVGGAHDAVGQEWRQP